MSFWHSHAFEVRSKWKQMLVKQNEFKLIYFLFRTQLRISIQTILHRQTVGITWRSQQLQKPIGNHAVWQKASAEPPLECDKWNQQLFLGIIAKDWLNLTKLLQNPPAIRKPQEPGYELSIEGESDEQVRDCNLSNQEKRVAWENQCQHLDNLGPTVGGIPWEEADINCRSYIYLCLGTEGQRKVTQYYPDLRIQEISIRDFWDRLQRLFVKERNVTFDRYESFTRKQGKT